MKVARAPSGLWERLQVSRQPLTRLRPRRVVRAEPQRNPIPGCALLSLIAGLAIAMPASADVLFLNDGTKVEGEVTDLGDRYQVAQTSGITSVYHKTQVARIERSRSSAEDFRTRRDSVAPDDAAGLLELAHWCAEKGLKTEAEQALRAAMAVASPLHRRAKRELADLLERSGRLREALALYEGLGRECADRAVEIRARLDDLRAAAFAKGRALLAERNAREAVAELERASQLAPGGRVVRPGAPTESEVLALLVEARKALAASMEKGRIALRPCPSCEAGGIVACASCGGRGQVQREHIIFTPRGSVRELRWVTCETCRGGGKVRCGRCAGVTVDIAEAETPTRTALRSLADAAFAGQTSPLDQALRRIHKWTAGRALAFGPGEPPYASSRALRDSVPGVPLAAGEAGRLRETWAAASPQVRANFLACYGLELARLLSLVPQGALKDADVAGELPLPEGPADLTAVSAFPKGFSGAVLVARGSWAGGPASQGGLQTEIGLDSGAPHDLHPFVWGPAARDVHARLGNELGLEGLAARAAVYPYGALDAALRERKPGERVDLVGRFFHDEPPAPGCRLEVWQVRPCPSEEMERAVAQLSRRVTFRFERTPLEAAAEMLSELTGVKIAIDVPPELGIAVTARVRQETLAHALTEMLRGLELAWALAPDGGVKIAPGLSEAERRAMEELQKLLPKSTQRQQ